MTTLVILLALILPRFPHPQRAGITEVNHVLSEDGSERLAQVIWWTWDPVDERHQVNDWRILRTWPKRVGSDWVWREHGFEVRTSQFRETWMVGDIELEERAVLPPERRRTLFRKRGSAP